MQKAAIQFIELLESQQLLSPEIVEELRRQVAESKTRLTPELLAKLLVDNGHLTKFQATKLIAEIKSPAEDPIEESQDREEELGFAPNSEPERKDKPQVAKVFLDDEASDVDVVQVETVEVEAVGGADVVDAVDVVETIDTVDVVQAIPDEARLDSTPKAVRKKAPQANPWDSYRILGTGGLLAFALILLYFLGNWFFTGSADTALENANSAYEQRSYETAADQFDNFAKSWPANENASYAKVKAVLARIREVSEGAPDPSLGLKTATELLPAIASESAMPGQQDDLAGALIALAEKFNDRADNSQETPKRKALMEEMDRLLGLINDPQFVGANQRNQQAPTLDRIKENRNRILREINRDEELVVAIASIDEKLAAKDALSAYDIRKDLINRYPLLEANEQLQERVRQASQIQQSLVTSGTLNPTLSKTAPETTIGKSYLLGNRMGSDAPQLSGELVFVRVKGSAYGIDAGTGEVLWRKYIGREFTSEPIRLGETSLVDALVCHPEKGQLSRVDGRSGETKWFVDFGVPTHMPVVEGEDLFVTTFDGQVASLDVGGGQVKWIKKLPQSIPAGVGVSMSRPNLYIAADHSNLYVLSRTDGSCREVFYLGHKQGSVVVPPVLLLGQLFVFENRSVGESQIRILSTSDEGLELADAQIPIPMEGHIVVSPQLESRKLVVLSDLGQVFVLDVEPTLKTDKVSILASVPKNLLKPKLSWGAFEGNKLWVADTRFTKFDLQVSQGKLNRAWIKNDGDVFSGPPQRFEKTIIHTRRLRGNQGARVAAVAADSGDPLWETDLGSPVTMLVSGEDRVYDAVNSSGMYFRLDSNPLRSKADSNPGQGKAAMMFANPVELLGGGRVLQNLSRPNQLAYASGGAEKLRVLSANFGSARPSCRPVAVDASLAVGLDNGQFILIDPSNGSLVASPYQPPMEPGKKVRWNSPAYLGNSKTLIVASDLLKLVRLSVGDSLRSLTEVDLELPLLGPIVPVGTAVCAVSSTRSGDSLTFFDATSLETRQSIALEGRLIEGPFAIEEGCLLQTDSKLVAVSADMQPLWSIGFPKSNLVSAPVRVGENLLCATRSGEVWQVKAASGEIIGRADVGQGLSSAPVVVSPELMVVGGDEGAVLAIKIPATVAGEL